MKAIEIAYLSLPSKTQRELALKLGQKPQAITRWIKTGKPPAKHCIAIEQLTGVSRHWLRPDVFGPQLGIKQNDHS